MTKIAVLGLGAMGARMAHRLIDAGHDVTLWNRTPDRANNLAAPRARTPAEAARDADIVIAMVTDDAASETVWAGPDGALAAMPSGALAVECSTVSPDRIAALAAEAAHAGVRFLDAPVAGSRPQAEAGELVFLIGGTAEDIARFAPASDAMGKAVLNPGPVGQGARLKLMVNALLAVQTAALAEILDYARDGGIAAGAAMDLLSPVPVTSPAAQFVGRQIAEGRHDPMFPIDLLVKDLGYLLKDIDAPVLTAVRSAFAAASDRGHGTLHISAVGA